MSKKITGDEPANILTIRQEFAARAMQGILSNTKLYDTIIEESNTDSGIMLREEIVAKESLMHADALIAELNKEV